MTWQPGDPIYDRYEVSVDTARAMVAVIDDLGNCRAGDCWMCNYGAKGPDSMIVQFPEERP